MRARAAQRTAAWCFRTAQCERHTFQYSRFAVPIFAHSYPVMCLHCSLRRCVFWGSPVPALHGGFQDSTLTRSSSRVKRNAIPFLPWLAVVQVRAVLYHSMVLYQDPPSPRPRPPRAPPDHSPALRAARAPPTLPRAHNLRRTELQPKCWPRLGCS